MNEIDLTNQPKLTDSPEQRPNRLIPEAIGNLSHELRSPLTAMKGIVSSLLQKDIEFDEEIRTTFLTGVLEEIVRLEGMITNLLDMSKLESGIWLPEKQTCSVYDLICETVERFKLIHRDHLFELKLPLDLPDILADSGQIKQVLTNLLDNACAYSEKTTRITVAAVNSNDGVVVSVADRGPGIDFSEREKIFDKYYRGCQKRLKPCGVGLGLTICRNIIRGHGGRMWVNSELGNGSTFSFLLPKV